MSEREDRKLMPLAKPQFLIGAAASGSGKTTFTMGLLRVLKRRGIDIQPFKCGPDYIDGKFHAIAAGRESVNLDTWLASENHVRQVYARYAREASACVAEGVMGLFDGYDRMKGSQCRNSRLRVCRDSLSSMHVPPPIPWQPSCMA